MSQPGADSIFMVLPYTPERLKTGGTGFLIETPAFGALIVSNRHVCEINGIDTKMSLVNKDEWYVGDKVALSGVTDLCLIVPPKELVADHRPLALANNRLRNNSYVNVVGHPHLRPLTVTGGRFINILIEPNMLSGGPFDPEMNMAIGRLDFVINPGNSGSPVLNLAGEVVGIVFAYDRRDSSGLFIPVAELYGFLADYAKSAKAVGN